jgi:hypothetical protein
MRGPRALLLAAAVAVASFAWSQNAVGEELGDVLRAPGLERPTASRFADPAWYDLIDVRWSEDVDRPAALVVEMAAIDEARPLLQPIVEAYLVDDQTPWRTLLPGSGVRLPEDRGWSVALRITADGAWAWSPEGSTAVARRLPVTIEGRTVSLAWPADLPTAGTWIALSGVFDPFSETGWRPFERDPSPWAFSTPEARHPVVDVFPGGIEALERVWSTGLLPLGRRAGGLGLGSGWWWLMGLGLVLGIAGLVWRRRPVVAEPTPEPAVVVVPTLPLPNVKTGTASAGAVGPNAPRPRPDPRWTPLIDDAEAPSESTVAPARAVREVRVEIAPFDQTPAEPPDVEPSSSEALEEGTETGSGSADPVRPEGASTEADADGASSREMRAPSDAKRSAKRS